MTPGNIARPPRTITCCCRGFVAIISPNRTDWRIRMQRMSSTCCCIQIIVYVAKCLKKKYLRKLIRKPFESNIETYKQFCITWCMNIYIYLFMIDPGGPMIHHNMANIAITHISVQRCDFGAPDVPVSRHRL